MSGLFLDYFSSVSVKDFENVLRPFLHNLGFSKNGILKIARRALGCKSGEFGFGYHIKHRN